MKPMGPASWSHGPLVFGISLKAYFGHAAAVAWVSEVVRIAAGHPAVADGRIELVLLPSDVSLAAAVECTTGSGIRIGAQDVFWESRGAFTGEVTADTLAEMAIGYVEIGHAERKKILGETPMMIRAKTDAAVRHGLVPILCVGEARRGPVAEAVEVCAAQLADALGGVAERGMSSPVVVAYEPEWAIGAERPAPLDHIVGVCAALSTWVAGRSCVAGSRIIYGGSAGPGLLDDLGDAVDGLFLGRFAHDPAAVDGILDDADRRLAAVGTGPANRE